MADAKTIMNEETNNHNIATTIDEVFGSRKAPPQQQQQQQRRAMVGAYSPVLDPTKDRQIVKAAQFAMDHLAESQQPYSFLPSNNDNDDEQDKDKQQAAISKKFSFQIVRAYQQVVAGLNYRLILMVQESSKHDDNDNNNVDDDKGTNCVGAFGVTIYDKFGDLSITKWAKELPCDVAAAALAANNEDLDFDQVIDNNDHQDEENGGRR